MGLVVSGNDADGRVERLQSLTAFTCQRPESSLWSMDGSTEDPRPVFAREFAPAQVSSDASEPTPLSRRSTHQIQSLQAQRINSVGLDQNEP